MQTNPAADAAFRAVYDATFEDVRRFCLRRLPVSDVNDAVSEAYLVACRKADKIPDGNEALPWLYGVTRNVVRQIERANRRRLRLSAKAMREPTKTAPGPEMQVIRRAEDEALTASIGRLSLADQEVIYLRSWEDLPVPAISTVLGCSVSAAEKRVARAFKRLEKTLATENSAAIYREVASKRGEA